MVLAARAATAALATPISSHPPTARPVHANPGQPGEERWIWLRPEADCRCRPGRPAERRQVDVPGRRPARRRPKIADYPFTTLHAAARRGRETDGREFVLADIPASLKGPTRAPAWATASSATIERCRVLLHLVDGTARARRQGLQDGARRARSLRRRPPSTSLEIVALVEDRRDDAGADQGAGRAAEARQQEDADAACPRIRRKGVPEALRALVEVIGKAADGKAEADAKKLHARLAALNRENLFVALGPAPAGTTANSPTSSLPVRPRSGRPSPAQKRSPVMLNCATR